MSAPWIQSHQATWAVCSIRQKKHSGPLQGHNWWSEIRSLLWGRNEWKMADYMELRACCWLHVQDMTRAKLIKRKQKENGTKYSFLKQIHVTLLHSLQLPTDSSDTSKCWWRINNIIHTVGLLELGYWPANIVVTAGQLLPPGGRNDMIHWATLTQLLSYFSSHRELRFLVLDSLHLDIITDKLINVRHHRGRLDVH